LRIGANANEILFHRLDFARHGIFGPIASSTVVAWINTLRVGVLT
jgi:hypothetical protein